MRLPATSPSVWGPASWRALHLLAEGYPEAPSPPARRHCSRFLRALAWMLPCESCGFHFRAFCRAYPGGLRRAASCRQELALFLVEAHNEVARHTRPAAPPWSLEEAEAAYASAPAPPGGPPLVWGGPDRLRRSEASQAECGCAARD